MKRFKTMVWAVISVGAALAFNLPSRADAKANPYVTIVDRNPFGLKPAPPPPEPPPAAPPAPPAKVILTGITSLFGPASKRALLEITEQEPGKPGAVTKPILREGERSGSIEVVSIDVQNNVVKIKNGTQETELKFEDPGKSVGSAPRPGMPGMPMPTPPIYNPNPPIPGAPQHNPGGPTIISPGSADNSSRGGGGVGLFSGSTPGVVQPAQAPFGVQPSPPAPIPPSLGSPDGATRIIPSRPVRMQPPAFPPAPGAKY